jgi:hypothetical protein
MSPNGLGRIILSNATMIPTIKLDIFDIHTNVHGTVIVYIIFYKCIHTYIGKYKFLHISVPI